MAQPPAPEAIIRGCRDLQAAMAQSKTVGTLAPEYRFVIRRPSSWQNVVDQVQDHMAMLRVCLASGVGVADNGVSAQQVAAPGEQNDYCGRSGLHTGPQTGRRADRHNTLGATSPGTSTTCGAAISHSFKGAEAHRQEPQRDLKQTAHTQKFTSTSFSAPPPPVAGSNTSNLLRRLPPAAIAALKDTRPKRDVTSSVWVSTLVGQSGSEVQPPSTLTSSDAPSTRAQRGNELHTAVPGFAPPSHDNAGGEAWHGYYSDSELEPELQLVLRKATPVT
jgi:hypothetical protein